MKRISMWSVLMFVMVASGAMAQTIISTIDMDTIPGDVKVVAATTIGLEADTTVTGTLATTGEVDAGAGVRFPDGTVQVSASAGATSFQSVTANSGLYSNKIPDITPSQDYTEVCFKAGVMQFDIHTGGEPTSGENCLPGDTGWIVERFERNAGQLADWTTARVTCLMEGMRLPEPFELQFTCDNAGLFAVSDLVTSTEWATNHADLVAYPSTHGAGILAKSGNSCDSFSWAFAGRSTGQRAALSYRCAL